MTHKIQGELPKPHFNVLGIVPEQPWGRLGVSTWLGFKAKHRLFSKPSVFGLPGNAD